MTPALLVAAAIWGSLVIYALTGGADFGGGVWDLFAHGPRAKDQRRLIANALGPIWEANHVWFILALVLLFIAFPFAFAAISISLHIPITLMLLGIVFRGAAFVFRSQETSSVRMQRGWGYAFSVASTITPVLLGIIVGAIASGSIVSKPKDWPLWNFISPWLAFFPVALGFFTLALFAFLAAVYLTVEARTVDLRNDFRIRALISGVMVGLFAWVCFILGKNGAPLIHGNLSHESWSVPFHLLTGIVALLALICLWVRRFKAARVLAIVQAILIFIGWGLAQYPFIAAPTFTISASAAPISVLEPLLKVILLGIVLVAPTFGFLFYIFKRH